MKIVQVTPRYPPHSGGVETHVREISERLVERGHDVTVLTADEDDDTAIPTRETRNDVAVRRHRGFAPGDAFHVAPGIYRTLRGQEADVIHAHNYHSLPALFAALAAGDEPFIVTPHYHGASASPFRDRLLSLYRPLGGYGLRRADRVIAVSNWERGRLAADFDVDATVIPNGIDVHRYRDVEPIERTRPYVLCVGRLVEYKGIQDVIRALPELPDFDLVVAGDGPYRHSLAEIAAERDVADRVDFIGYVPDEDLPGLYAGATAYVTLSRFEAYGMTVGEALAAGTPCVVRPERALGDWLDTDGVVPVSSGAPQAIASAIETAADFRPIDDVALPTWDVHVDGLERMYRGTSDEKG